MFSIVAAAMHILTNTAKVFPVLHRNFLTLVFSCLFDDSYSNMCEVRLTVVLICLSLMISDVKHLFMYLLAICIIF